MFSLAKQIEEFKLQSRANMKKETQDIMLKVTKTLVESNLKNKALKVGDKITPFSLLNANMDIRHIQDIIDKNKYTILSFYRGAWCPYCNLELKALQKIQPELKILQTKLVAISPQTPNDSMLTKEKNKLTFEVLCDKNNTIGRKMGIVYSLPEELHPIYKDMGIDVLGINKNGTFEIPLAATFVINNSYEIIYRFVDEDHTKRLEPNDMLKAIKKDIINSH